MVDLDLDCALSLRNYKKAKHLWKSKSIAKLRYEHFRLKHHIFTMCSRQPKKSILVEVPLKNQNNHEISDLTSSLRFWN